MKKKKFKLSDFITPEGYIPFKKLKLFSKFVKKDMGELHGAFGWEEEVIKIINKRIGK